VVILVADTFRTLVKLLNGKLLV